MFHEQPLQHEVDALEDKPGNARSQDAPTFETSHPDVDSALEMYIGTGDFSYKTRVVDASGAGDAFNAGYIAGILRGHDTYTAVKLGCAAASFVIEQWGCQTNLPTWEAVMKRYGEMK